LQHEAASEEWLNEVHLNMIHLHLNAECINLTRFPVDRLLADGWQGSCTHSLRDLTSKAANLHADALKAAPSIRKWAIDTCGEMEPEQALTSGLMQAQNALEVFKSAGMDAAEAVQAFSWTHTVGPHVLEGVAMTRAMRILWQRWLSRQGFGQASIWLDARTYLPPVGDGLKTDRLIGMTSAAYASVIGGSDALEVVPHDADAQLGSADGKRWARNVQHLMREEAGLHRVFDPMGGSRVVESWTASLVETVWEAFENRIAP
jgi:methylmalonyl-CoA mutase